MISTRSDSAAFGSRASCPWRSCFETSRWPRSSSCPITASEPVPPPQEDRTAVLRLSRDPVGPRRSRSSARFATPSQARHLCGRLKIGRCIEAVAPHSEAIARLGCCPPPGSSSLKPSRWTCRWSGPSTLGVPLFCVPPGPFQLGARGPLERRRRGPGTGTNVVRAPFLDSDRRLTCEESRAPLFWSHAGGLRSVHHIVPTVA
jgi:hypothetical protein